MFFKTLNLTHFVIGVHYYLIDYIVVIIRAFLFTRKIEKVKCSFLKVNIERKIKFNTE